MPVAPDPHLRAAAAGELRNIGEWWLTHTLDATFGGYSGEVDYYGKPVVAANKGAVLNGRILWFFSELALFEPRQAYRDAADRAFRYFIDHFDDGNHGGTYWELDCRGAIANDKKQIYALCFYIYALAAYYRLTSNSLALHKALQYVDLIETHAKDAVHGGYLEAFSRDWQRLDDMRLSDRDLNTPKTMNTHLHLLEAYTALHRAAPTPRTSAALRDAIAMFRERIVDSDSGHLKLFFDLSWHSISPVISYGHDIEASWLLWEAGEVLGDTVMLGELKPIVMRLANLCVDEGLGERGQLYGEFDPTIGHSATEGSWWVQAEAMVGFLNAWQISGDVRYIDACETTWQFIRDHCIDTVNGEWHWLASCCTDHGNRNYKAGSWKGPYHNGRAMLETCKRLARSV